jgi:uncharacterized membrane protein
MSGAELAHAVVGVLAAVTGVGAAVVGGVFFAFSGFVMRGLADVGQHPGGAGSGTRASDASARVGIAAMQAINRAAVRPPLMVLLFGTMLAGLATCILLAVVGGGHALWWGFAGEVVYVAGVVVTTVAFHVPRNDALGRLDPGAVTAWANAPGAGAGAGSGAGSGADAGAGAGSGSGEALVDSWQRYVVEWTRGNHVRALAGVLAGVLFGVAAFLVGAPLLMA